MTRVLVASASPVVRAGLEALLGGLATTVLRSSGELASLPDEVESAEPEVVLLELGPGEEAPLPLPLAHDALARAPAIVLLADAHDAGSARRALRAGVRAVLPRTATAGEILAAVEAAAAGLVALPRDLAHALVAAPAHTAPRTLADAPNPTLTPREVEVLGMLAEGLGNKALARRLGISTHTAKAHVASILGKLQVSTRTEAVTVGVRLGLVLL